MKWPTQLSTWFKKNQRPMPWRDRPSPYNTWVSEIMLQQTQVITVIPYFNRFIQKFPTINDLATAKQQDVLLLWEGLGYYSRARNLHKAANLIVSDYNSTLPESYEDLQKIPGIGPYVAAAITSIAFSNPVPVVDGNVLRVFTRFWGIPEDIRDPKVRNKLFEKLTPIIKTQNPPDFNQAIMELGALLCTPKSPKCSECPISNDCYAKKNNKTAQLPYKSKKAPVPHHNIVVGIIWKDDKFLIGKRKQNAMLGGLWEFPGGKQKENETQEEALRREITEETTLKVDIHHKITTIKHAYTHFKITLHAYHCTHASGTEKPLATDALKWITSKDLPHYPFPTANKKLLPHILNLIQAPI